MNKKVIMISGSTYNSGKDTVANELKTMFENSGKIVRIIGFGDWVKDSLKRYYNWDGNKDEAGRHLLQTYATDEVRTNDPTYWADVVARLCKATDKDWDILIVSDLRFPNEYCTMCRYFDYKNVTAIKVNRNIISNDVNRGHSSEHSLDAFLFDYNIDNNGTLENLHEQIISVYDKIMNDYEVIV